MDHLHEPGTSSTGPRDRGLFIGGGGTIEDLTIADSLVGLVVGRANANFLDITIRDSGTGIVTDGNLGRGGAVIEGLLISGCDVAIVARNSGIISVNEGTIRLGSEDGLNLTRGTVTLRDSWVSAPATGKQTAVLRDLSTLNLVNSVTTQSFDIGPDHNTVNFYWYLNLTLRYHSNRAPISEGLVTVREVSGTVVAKDLKAGIDGILEKAEMREKSLTPNAVIMTPHTITVSKGGLKDSFTITMDGSKDYTFDLDNHPPVLTVSYPEDGALLNTSTVTFQGEAFDSVITDTEGLASMNYRVDGGNWTPIALPAVKTWSFVVTLDDGFHAVEVEVYDRIGNHNLSVVSVEVSTQEPDLTLLAPDEGMISPQTEILIIGHTNPGIEVRVNGVLVNVTEDGAFNWTMSFPEGANVLTVTATDAVGNTALVTRNVTVDTILPEVVLDDAGPYITKEPTYILSGSKEENATIYVNGYLPGLFGSDEFTTTIDLVEGPNPVLIFSVDLAGNNWSKTIVIDLDSTPPSLSVASLPDHTNVPSLTVQGNTDDTTTIITVNDHEVTLSGLTFAYTLTLLEGTNTITVRAMDLLGNEAETVVHTVELDTVPPSMELDVPKYVTTTDDQYNLSGETEPGLTVVVFVTYKVYSKTYNVGTDGEGNFEVTVALPQVGNHSVTVTVLDKAGNKATADLYFERERPDVKPPDRPDEPSWFEDNWALVILMAAIVGAGAVLLFTFSSVKRRKEAMMARAMARRQDQRGPEDGDEEGPDDTDDGEEVGETDDDYDDGYEDDVEEHDDDHDDDDEEAGEDRS